ncbi:hypothetical protein [Streptomyces angustmyceticus]|uniref:hypothetical protein n=1 Tax=Streptomyces angustmyceticus TaxID=285578 RepID=UPI003D8A3D5F
MPSVMTGTSSGTVQTLSFDLALMLRRTGAFVHSRSQSCMLLADQVGGAVGVRP